MGFRKDDFIVGFALFALFFGVGNIVLPPMLGFLAGQHWYLVTLGFVITAIGIPLLGILAHAKLQGTMMDFGTSVSKPFALIFCIVIYIISVSIPSPRTASFTYEMAIEPFFNISALTVSIVYFILVFLFVAKRSTVLNNIGKLLTPAILILVLLMIFLGIFEEVSTIATTKITTPILDGFFEGYQTFDAIGALVVGGVIIVSVKLKGYTEHKDIKTLIIRSACISAIGLLIIYSGLIYEGAHLGGQFSEDITRTQLLNNISKITLGKYGSICLAILVSLACFTTAVGIITGTADFFSSLFKSKYTYIISVSIACIVGVGVGALSVDAIITLALPILMLAYPLTIALIVLNILPKPFKTPTIMRLVVIFTTVFSIPDALKFITPNAAWLPKIQSIIPFSEFGLGWVIPAIIGYCIGFVISKRHK